MTAFLVIRHGATAWTEAGRLQGRADPALSASGRAALAGRRVPAAFAGARWLTSPLRRARETARLLGAPEAAIEACLIEMDWGAWEGRRLAEIRAELGPSMAANEARGLDFRPEGGESPREVQARLAPLLGELAGLAGPVIALTHKGVIRALLALATGWDMRNPPPARLAWDRGHAFTVAPGGGVTLEAPNLALDGR